MTMELKRQIHELRIALEDARALLRLSLGSADERIVKADLRISLALDPDAKERAAAQRFAATVQQS